MAMVEPELPMFTVRTPTAFPIPWAAEQGFIQLQFTGAPQGVQRFQRALVDRLLK